MPIEGIDYFVRMIDLPPSIGGFVKPNDDGTFSVYLNSRLSHLSNVQSCDHERNHILHNDFYRSTDIATMEKEASA